jgi:hypothetical protein
MPDFFSVATRDLYCIKTELTGLGRWASPRKPLLHAVGFHAKFGRWWTPTVGKGGAEPLCPTLTWGEVTNNNDWRRLYFFYLLNELGGVGNRGEKKETEEKEQVF